MSDHVQRSTELLAVRSLCAAQPAALGAFTATAASVEPRRSRNERRSSMRVPCCVRVLDRAGEVAATLSGETVNVSPEGIAIQLGQPLARGTQVEALIAHSVGSPLIVCGAVVHSRRVITGTFEIGISQAELAHATA